MALLWCLLICLTAINIVGTDEKDEDGVTDATGQMVQAQDVAMLRNAFGD